MATKRALIKEKQQKQRNKLDENLVNAVLEKDTDSKHQNQKVKRTRRFCLTTYIDVNAVDIYLRSLSWVQHWAYCTHDRDYNEDGTQKELHTHILLYTYEAKTASAIKKNFDNFSQDYYCKLNLDKQNTLVQECNDMCSQFRYLRHLDDTNKAPYLEFEVHTDDLSYWNTLHRTNGMTDSVGNTGFAILNDYMNGVDCYTMAKRYGKEWIYHISHYKQALNTIASEQTRSTFGGLLEMCQFALADSTYTENQLTIFYSILAYVQTKFEDNGLREDVRKFLKS